MYGLSGMRLTGIFVWRIGMKRIGKATAKRLGEALDMAYKLGVPHSGA